MKKTILLITIAVISLSTKAQMKYVAEPIDLGLSVRWASCNIGALRPEQFGKYFAWGEIQAKEEFKWNNYAFSGDKKGKTITRYNETDKLTTLSPDDDAASVILEREPTAWRIPTADEWDELRDRCLWEFVNLNGINGYKVTGPNGNHIFIPASDEPMGKNKKSRNMTALYYWTADISDKPQQAFLFYAPDNRPEASPNVYVGSGLHMGINIGPFTLGSSTFTAPQNNQAKQTPANITTVAGKLAEKRCYGTPIRPVCPK